MGIMASPWKNLLKAKHELVVYDRQGAQDESWPPAPRGRLRQGRGGAVPLIITIVPNSPHVKRRLGPRA